MSQSSSYGSVGPFEPSIEDWSAYQERFTLFFAANDITDDSRRKAIFLTTCRAVTYGLFRSLASPDKPADISLKQLWERAAAHYHLKPSRAVQRFRFNSRVHQPGESVAMYLAELKSLLERCDFRDTLNDMLRDRIVCGIHDQRTQRRLLAETDLTLKISRERLE